MRCWRSEARQALEVKPAASLQDAGETFPRKTLRGLRYKYTQIHSIPEGLVQQKGTSCSHG